MTASFRMQIVACALGLALVTAVGVLLAPGGLLTALVGRTGLAAILPAAAPPLGMTARLLLATAAALAVGLGFAALTVLLERDRRLRRRRARAARSADADAPALRRGDTHPDAPARRPLLATADLPEAEEAEPEPAPEPAPIGIAARLDDLLARLEAGLARRDGHPPPVSAALIAGVDATVRDSVDALERSGAHAS